MGSDVNLAGTRGDSWPRNTIRARGWRITETLAIRRGFWLNQLDKILADSRSEGREWRREFDQISRMV